VQRCKRYVTEELMEKTFHPKVSHRLSSWGYEEFDDLDLVSKIDLKTTCIFFK